MNIRLNPHSEQLLQQQLTQGQFRSAEEVIERALETLAENLQRKAAMSHAEFEATLDALADGSERMPILSPEATSRSEIYRNHS